MLFIHRNTAKNTLSSCDIKATIQKQKKKSSKAHLPLPRVSGIVAALPTGSILEAELESETV